MIPYVRGLPSRVGVSTKFELHHPTPQWGSTEHMHCYRSTLQAGLASYHQRVFEQPSPEGIFWDVPVIAFANEGPP
jgi:hypothetical protein